MTTKLASILTVLFCVSTLVTAVLILVGSAPAILFALVSALAIGLWFWTGEATPEKSRNVLTPYLLVPPLLLALDTVRYIGGWVELLELHHSGWFDPTFSFTSSNWFVLLVCTPATMILLGGYMLSQNMRVGHYIAWWTALYAAVEGIVQLTAGFSAGTGLLTWIGAALGLGLIGLAVLIAQQLLMEKAAQTTTAAPLSDRQRLQWAIFFVATVALYGAILFNQAGPLPVVIISGSMLGGMVSWWVTTSRSPVDPSWAVPLFLLLLTFFYIHVGEEALTGFSGMISQISGKEWNDRDFMLVIGLAGPVLWFFAAWSLWKRQPIGNFNFWFLIVGMILGEPTNLLVFPVRRMLMLDIGYEYASGMYTALFPVTLQSLR